MRAADVIRSEFACVVKFILISSPYQCILSLERPEEVFYY